MRYWLYRNKSEEHRKTRNEEERHWSVSFCQGSAHQRVKIHYSYRERRGRGRTQTLREADRERKDDKMNSSETKPLTSNKVKSSFKFQTQTSQ